MQRSLLLRTLRCSSLNKGKSTANSINVISRSFGGGGGSSHGHEAHGPPEPYAVPHHKEYSDKPMFLHQDPDKPYEWQGWEIPSIGTILICALLMIFGDHKRDNFDNWCMNEARARIAIKAEGGEIEFGKWYSDQKSVITSTGVKYSAGEEGAQLD